MKENILITGDSKGLGKYLLENLSEKYNIFLISREKIEKIILNN